VAILYLLSSSHSVYEYFSIHYVKRAGAVLATGSLIAKLELDDINKVQKVFRQLTGSKLSTLV